ncbi:hypothetical protein S245_009595 [Arachis hypogaea]
MLVRGCLDFLDFLIFLFFFQLPSYSISPNWNLFITYLEAAWSDHWQSLIYISLYPLEGQRGRKLVLLFNSSFQVGSFNQSTLASQAKNMVSAPILFIISFS